ELLVEDGVLAVACEARELPEHDDVEGARVLLRPVDHLAEAGAVVGATADAFVDELVDHDPSARLRLGAAGLDLCRDGQLLLRLLHVGAAGVDDGADRLGHWSPPSASHASRSRPSSFTT